MQTYSYIGKGPIYIGPQDGSGPLINMGNASQLELTAAEEKKEQQDYQSTGGGLANSVTRITGMTANITALELNPANIARGLRGITAAVAAGAAPMEAHTAYLGGLIPLNSLPDTTVTVTVTGPSATPAYTEGTDYILTRAGLIITDGSTIPDGTGIEVTYTRLASDEIEALTNSGIEYKMVFNGLNEASSDQPVVVTLHRVKFSPTSGLALLGDEFAELPMAADVLKDAAIVGGGLSQYAKIAMAR